MLISGRLTDITWSKTGDLTEIVVQSFGTELVQQIKTGAYVEAEKNIFPTTHHLLGNLMLSPELKHFGRWEHDKKHSQPTMRVQILKTIADEENTFSIK